MVKIKHVQYFPLLKNPESSSFLVNSHQTWLKLNCSISSSFSFGKGQNYVQKKKVKIWLLKSQLPCVLFRQSARITFLLHVNYWNYQVENGISCNFFWGCPGVINPPSHFLWQNCARGHLVVGKAMRITLQVKH